jgi:hypothetical protein
MILKNGFFTILMGLLISAPLDANATLEKEGHRFSLSGGLVSIEDKTSFAVSAEYEYRVDPLYGIGAQGSYVFSSLAVTQLAAPGFYLHPLSGEWYISAAPVFYFASGADTLAGARFTTRMPLLIKIMTLTPTLGVDFIRGGPNYIFGLGIAI